MEFSPELAAHSIRTRFYKPSDIAMVINKSYFQISNAIPIFVGFSNETEYAIGKAISPVTHIRHHCFICERERTVHIRAY